MGKNILLTGGAGYIGSHTYVALFEAGHSVTILDNFENAKRDVPDRLTQITSRSTPVIDCDIRDDAALMKSFRDNEFDAVIHFAAKKSVSEGDADPVGYYRSNCAGLINVASAMRACDVNVIVFSSSASVYGNTDKMPIAEDAPTRPISTYGITKLFGEQFLNRVVSAHPDFRVGILRYFNPVGAHSSGLIGDDPITPASNLVPLIAKVAHGKRESLDIYGGDYPTPDGTAIRDYIHIADLARGHLLSLEALLAEGNSHLVNLGTGKGYSVLEAIKSYSNVVGRDLPYTIVDRRPGDPAMSYAETTKARETLGFEARYGLKEMCESDWVFDRLQHAVY